MTFHAFISSQSLRIDQIQRIIVYIGIEVESAIEADRVGAEIAASLRIIKSVPVVVQPGLGVKVLARE